MQYLSQTISINRSGNGLQIEPTLEIGGGSININGIIYSTKTNDKISEAGFPEIRKVSGISCDSVELTKEEEKKFYDQVLKRKIL